MLVVEGFLQDAAEVETVVRIGQSHPIPHHLRPEELFFAGLRYVACLREVYPGIANVNAQPIGQENEKERNQPVRTVLG